MENKYQKALKQTISILNDLAQYVTSNKTIILDNTKILQELVDRETPEKPLKQFRTGVFICSVCKCAAVNYGEQRCHVCGQKLDWSN